VARYYNGWAPYVPAAERRRKAALAMQKLRKKGHPVAPVVIQGRMIATTFWGKAWCENLESYRDYESRLPRGRTYVRNGSVVDLQIAPTEITAMVSGSSIYKVKISIDRVRKEQWGSICKDCSGGVDSLVELLQGRFSKGVMERLCRQGGGLFPKPAEIRFSCTCPDYASLCKHVAAVLYGVGARLDEQPELLFRLRAVDEKELVARIDAALPAAKQVPASNRVLDSDDLSALFGLDIDSGEGAVAIVDDVPPARQRPVTPRKPTQSKLSSSSTPRAAGHDSTGLPGRGRIASEAMIKNKATANTLVRNGSPRKPSVRAKGSKIP
jgi:uncharacterized Zn finger protein